MNKAQASKTAKPAIAELVVTHCMVFPFKERRGKTLAMARVALNEQLQLTGLRIVDGVDGYFVSYPLDPQQESEEYHSIFYPLTKELREHIEIKVLEKYAEIRENETTERKAKRKEKKAKAASGYDDVYARAERIFCSGREGE
jgi:stage V sporulation protein G